VKRLLAAIASRLPTVDCCPHPDPSEDPDTAYLPADTTHHDYRGTTR
jgi:hypothetical protein